MHLADAFIQCDLQCIQSHTFIVSMCVPWELNPQPLQCNAMLYHWATGTLGYISKFNFYSIVPWYICILNWLPKCVLTFVRYCINGINPMTLMTLDFPAPLPAQCSLKCWATGSGCDQSHQIQKSSLIFAGLTDTGFQFNVAWYLFI